MDLSKEYVEDLLVRMSHHSSAIENNTISLPETVSIILHNTVPNKVSLRELYEIDNHRHAMEYLLSPETLKKDFTFDILFETHAILMDRLHHERGKFKTEENFMKGADFDAAHPKETPMLMKQWIDNVNFRLNTSHSDKDVIDLVCESHIEFERIHPFADGNGRTGRLIMNYLLLKKDIAPLIIEKKDKERYIYFIANQDGKSFSDFAEEKIKKEQKRIKSFAPSKVNKKNKHSEFES
ncbi:Fic family protein [Siminovitchia sp. FSL H7-0308]|uniref:Fic family protein n=1 Tax=Siminovitchia thermophila TaxID=1245522 RepID=A0ABS2R5S2_9BACI|nr:Fic family protein [Siminovitchia thermophila]MBM7714725.1 Fic family protein [Siminovitchia thermophila]